MLLLISGALPLGGDRIKKKEISTIFWRFLILVASFSGGGLQGSLFVLFEGVPLVCALERHPRGQVERRDPRHVGCTFFFCMIFFFSRVVVGTNDLLSLDLCRAEASSSASFYFGGFQEDAQLAMEPYTSKFTATKVWRP